MGWNSWNWFGKEAINEQIVCEVIDAMVTNGLRDAGYRYVVVDGGWRDTQLDSDGRLRAHPVKFPRGMKHLADYAHSKGLKFGLHTVPGTHDCRGDAVGGFGREEVHVKQFVDWGVDFIKLDKCQYADGWSEPLLQATYAKWRDLLQESGRDVVLSISAYTWRDWYPQVGQMARTTGDIRGRIHKGGAVFDGDKRSVMQIAGENNCAASFAGNGYWNDPDMLVIGEQGLTVEEQKAHFALWCLMSAPLMLGNDPRNMTPTERESVLNQECIQINQDPTEQGRRIKVDGDAQVWAKKLSGGRIAVLLINCNATEPKTVSASWLDLSLRSSWKVRDVYGNADLGSEEASLAKLTPPHACWFLLLSAQPGGLSPSHP